MRSKLGCASIWFTRGEQFRDLHRSGHRRIRKRQSDTDRHSGELVMSHKVQVLIEMVRDPWFYYFLFWFVVIVIIYLTGDKWKK